MNTGGVLNTVPDKWLNKCYYPQAPWNPVWKSHISFTSPSPSSLPYSGAHQVLPDLLYPSAQPSMATGVNP